MICVSFIDQESFPHFSASKKTSGQEAHILQGKLLRSFFYINSLWTEITNIYMEKSI